MTRRHFCGLAACGLAAGCAVNPATGERDLILVGPEAEKQIGFREHPKILAQFGGVYEDAAVAGYVAAIGGRLAAATETPSIGFTFTLLNSPIVNAFALPGGYVYISRGLLALAGDEAELAGVLGHEIGHVVARHSAQRQSRTMLAQLGVGLLGALAGGGTSRLAGGVAGLYLKGYSREQELEADMLGIRYLRRTGYDVNAMASFLKRLRAHSQLQARIAGRAPGEADAYDLSSTHPRTADRVRRAVSLSGGARDGARGRGVYFDAVDGMIFGNGPEQGYVLGRRFAHSKLRFEFTVPPGFTLRNTPGRVMAASTADRAAISFDAAPKPFQGAMTAYLPRVWARRTALNDLEAITINGLEAATGWVRARVGKVPTEFRLIAIRFDARTVFRFVFAAPPAAMRRLATPFQRASYSFRRLSPAQAAALKPKRLRIVTVAPSDTIESLSAQMAFGKLRRERFTTLNGLTGNDRLVAGARVKTVVRST